VAQVLAGDAQIMNEDDDSAAWHHVEQTERQRTEDEALERCRRITAEHNAANDEFARSTKEFWERVKQ
jgi:hypothetical protein